VIGSAGAAIEIEPVTSSNWRAVAKLGVNPEQERFVAPVLRYLALCAYGGLGWEPFAIHRGGELIGFVMSGAEEEDNSYWIGGFIIDSRHQRRGYGRRAMEILIERAREHGSDTAALSYEPENVGAKALYADLGFMETGEMDGEEVVARLQLRRS
jgi:diamine N-acetyltransferase